MPPADVRPAAAPAVTGGDNGRGLAVAPAPGTAAAPPAEEAAAEPAPAVPNRTQSGPEPLVATTADAAADPEPAATGDDEASADVEPVAERSRATVAEPVPPEPKMPSRNFIDQDLFGPSSSFVPVLPGGQRPPG
jgi:hypothetical protein